jgi:hypothetical protein
MLLVYLILVVVSVCTTIVAVYFVLNAENYHWQVRLFGSMYVSRVCVSVCVWSACMYV